ncbi:MAG: hypothetical protein ACLRSW_16515 [Christensenellaceae bacterium]
MSVLGIIIVVFSALQFNCKRRLRWNMNAKIKNNRKSSTLYRAYFDLHLMGFLCCLCFDRLADK